MGKGKEKTETPSEKKSFFSFLRKNKNPEAKTKDTVEYINGDVYTGELLDGDRDGFGTHRYADGSEYVGNWKSDLYNGHGTFTGADGTHYSGDHILGARSGHGELAPEQRRFL